MFKIYVMSIFLVFITGISTVISDPKSSIKTRKSEVVYSYVTVTVYKTVTSYLDKDSFDSQLSVNDEVLTTRNEPESSKISASKMPLPDSKESMKSLSSMPISRNDSYKNIFDNGSTVLKKTDTTVEPMRYHSVLNRGSSMIPEDRILKQKSIEIESILQPDYTMKVIKSSLICPLDQSTTSLIKNPATDSIFKSISINLRIPLTTCERISEFLTLKIPTLSSIKRQNIDYSEFRTITPQAQETILPKERSHIASILSSVTSIYFTLFDRSISTIDTSVESISEINSMAVDYNSSVTSVFSEFESKSIISEYLPSEDNFDQIIIPRTLISDTLSYSYELESEAVSSPTSIDTSMVPTVILTHFEVKTISYPVTVYVTGSQIIKEEKNSISTSKQSANVISQVDNEMEKESWYSSFSWLINKILASREKKKLIASEPLLSTPIADNELLEDEVNIPVFEEINT
jgi:hypothetical protein